ncbi:DNA-directed RNA polymerase subunit D [Candidatus Woesearchaeota archaeon]|nr:DNA-directed RNA polymerase subunit D [Candidatus Woesearchaeota archaeon]
MEITMFENKKKYNRVSFILTDASPAFANTLRRLIMDEVPTLAIEDVEFRKNTSVLYDEIIAHRLGLIPLATDIDSYKLPEECTCKGEGCSQCQVHFSLKAKGPGMVYASELVSKDPKIIPVFPKTPIVKLGKGQVLELEATAVLGKGQNHVKWSPGMAYYKYKPQIELAKGIPNPKEVVQSCPVDVYDLKNNQVAINKDNELRCHLCGNCVDVAPNHVKLNESDKEFVFFVESWGQLSAKEMVERSLEIFKKKLDDFCEHLNA